MDRLLRSLRSHCKQSSEDASHPGLWLVIALVCAMVGAFVSLSRPVSELPELAIANEAPVLVDMLLGPAAPAEPAKPQAH